MNNLKLAVKLGFGFGALILIAAILGGVAIVSMKGVEATPPGWPGSTCRKWAWPTASSGTPCS